MVCLSFFRGCSRYVHFLAMIGVMGCLTIKLHCLMIEDNYVLLDKLNIERFYDHSRWALLGSGVFCIIFATSLIMIHRTHDPTKFYGTGLARWLSTGVFKTIFFLVAFFTGLPQMIARSIYPHEPMIRDRLKALGEVSIADDALVTHKQ